MTHEPKALEDIRQRIEELAPSAGFYEKHKPIDFTLEDVLMAKNAQIDADFSQLMAEWRLGVPLSKQPPEIINFILALLCKE